MMKKMIRSKAERKAAEFEHKLDEVARKVVKRFSRGNVSMQSGRVLSKEALDVARKKRWG